MSSTEVQVNSFVPSFLLLTHWVVRDCDFNNLFGPGLLHDDFMMIVLLENDILMDRVLGSNRLHIADRDISGC